MNDPDWLLAGDGLLQNFGFIPSNYIQLASKNGGAPPPVEKDHYISPQAFVPPPVHPSKKSDPAPPVVTPLALSVDYNATSASSAPPEDDSEEDAPPMPSRPPTTPQRTKSQSSVGSKGYLADDGLSLHDASPASGGTKHGYDGNFFNWYIDEIEGHRKRPVVLSVGQSLIILKPNTESRKRFRTASAIDNQWRIRDLKSYSTEKKHLFLELRNPLVSLELHAGSKDVADAILSVISEMKGADSGRGLDEVARASQADRKPVERKRARLLYDFVAQGDDELGGKEGHQVYVVDDTKSEAWWLCEDPKSGKRGVIPSSYIELLDASSDDISDVRRSKLKRHESSRGRVVEPTAKNRRHDRDERDRIRESDRALRDNKKPSKSDKTMPNFHRVRTWIDSLGSFKVEAEFLGCVDGKIHLHKTNGVKIAVAATKLSIEDLEYVEKITGASLQSYKDQILSASAKIASPPRGASGVSSKSATAAINDVPPEKPMRPTNTGRAAYNNGEDEYDWFDFFLACGVDVANCQRYTLNFGREQMAENILEDITPSLLRTLGLREGDILRVMKYLDTKFDRKSAQIEPQATNGGGMFTEASGSLKNNNSQSDVSKVHAGALPSPTKNIQPEPAAMPKFDDDAWALKPAARPVDTQRPQTPQYTGHLLDLVNIKPLDTSVKQTPTTPSAPSLQPVKTGPSSLATVSQPQPQPQVLPQTTAGTFGNQATGLVPVRTGGLVPVPTGGLIPVQPTGFLPIASQPTGFIPIQATGLAPQLTFGLIPLQTGPNTFAGQMTGGLTQTTFGQAPSSFQPLFVPLQTGAMTMPQTSFGQGPSYQQTTPLIPVRTGGIQGGQMTGMQPSTSFQLQLTGGQFANPPSTTFQQQLTGGLPMAYNLSQPQLQPQQPTGGFGQAFQPQSLFGQAMVTGGMPPSFQQTGMAGQPSFGGMQQPNQFGQFNTFGQQQQPQNLFGQFPQPMQQQPPTSFGMMNQAPQQQMNNLSSMFQNTAIGAQQNQFNPQGQQQSAPNTSFGQQTQFEGFNQPSLQLQPTGAGFGNAPLSMQSQPTGKRANLNNATADNPFGF